MVPVDREDRIVAWFAALAIVVHVLEAGFPSPVPGIKPGLANVVTLIVLQRYGLRLAVWVAVLRVLVGSLLIGSFLTPTFWLSVSGAVFGLTALAAGWGWNRLMPWAPLSVLGLSVAAAVAHMGGQFLLAYHVFVPHPGLLNILPLLLAAALAFGAVSGWVAAAVLRRLPLIPESEAAG